MSPRKALPAEERREKVRLLLERLRALGTRQVDLWFADLSGRRWRISAAPAGVEEEAFVSGTVVDGKSIGEPWEGFLLLLPDPDALFLDPTASVPSAAVFCDVAVPATREPHPLDPRRALRAAEAYMVESGIADTCVLGAEPEFFMLRDGAAAPEDECYEFLRMLAAALRDSGVGVDWFRSGPGEGQGRVQMRPGPPLKLADQVMFYKYLARSLAHRAGLQVTFLPKPRAGPAIGGMPVHVALWKDGVNQFFDEGGWLKTSAACRRYAGGLLKHARALTGICAPTLNSYRRLIPGTGAPTDLVLSAGKRSAVCRIPAGTAGASAGNRRVKFCAPDAAADPYLCFAATLMAGLDGIENKLEPVIDESRAANGSGHSNGSGHANGNGYHVPQGRVPDSLEESLEALAADTAFLKKGGAFTNELLKAWTDGRWRDEIRPVRSIPHPAELRLEDGR